MSKGASRLGRGLGSLISGGMQSPKSNPKEKKPSNPDKNSGSLKGGKTAIQKKSTSSALKNSDGLSEIPLDAIVPNPYQPRKIIDPVAIEELAASIKSEGLLQPVVVRKVGDQFELVAGERRWRAHQHLGKKKILVRVLTASDISSASLSLIENLQREGLNPIEEAMGYYALVNEFNLTQAKVAERVGKSRAHIANLIRILQLDDDIQSFLSSHKLSLGHAKVLLGIDDLKVRKKIANQAADEGWTVRDCERAVVEFRNPKQVSLISRVKRPNPFADIAKIAESNFNRRVSIQSDTLGKGKVSFHFSDESDLLSLIENLGISLD